jgi:hypothetical protein
MRAAPASARATCAQRRQKWPPPEPGRVERIVAALRPALPAAIVAKLDDGTVTVGEEGQTHPDAGTFPLAGAEFYIGVTTGMFRFVEAVTFAIAHLLVAGPGAGSDAAMASALDELRSSLTVFRKQTSLVWTVLGTPTFAVGRAPSDAAAAAFASDLVDASMHFIVAHEFGHVAIGLGLDAGDPALEESRADRLGLRTAVEAALQSAHQSVAVAGAGLAVRMLVSLERAGVTFSHVYPPMAQRLADLDAVLLTFLGAQQKVDELTRVMVSLLDAVDDLDRRLDPKAPVPPMSEDRVRVGIVARLYELARNGIDVATFLTTTFELAHETSPDAFARALGAVCDAYWPWAPTAGMYVRDLAAHTIYEHGWLVANSRALRDAIAHMTPEQLQSVPEGYRTA